MPAFTSIVATGAAIYGAVSSASAAKTAGKRARETERELKRLESGRQAIIDPYANVKDLSGMVTNPFANLQVATQAAEMQARETDITLASTLDLLRATGASAGGATALAQAAARSKQGISASIEQQEAENARLRAQGEQQMQQIKMQEAARLQTAEVAGKQFVFGTQEEREMQRLNRLAGLQANYQQQQATANASLLSSFGSLAQSIGSMDLSKGRLQEAGWIKPE